MTSYVRSPAVSGRFYPAEPDELREEIRGFLAPPERAGRRTPRTAVAIVAPHAGYMYSGAIAGEVYASVEVPEAAVVLCPNHTGAGARAAIVSRGAFRTPIGDLPIQQRLAELIKTGGGLVEDHRAHAQEHAIEVHLPFLLERNPRVQLVPICLAGLSFDACARLGSALAAAIRAFSAPVLLVASTDMSHYIPAAQAAVLDRMAIDHVEHLDGRGLYETVVARDISMCGFIPTTAAIEAARQLGARQAQLVRYGHSGEVSGDLDHVVGYAGLVVD